jgi:5-methylcytosine-specific restriction endonuclease McrA
MSWSRKHDRCVACGTTDRRHVAQGHCAACYRRRRRSGELGRVREIGAVEGTPPDVPRVVAGEPGRWSSVSDACLDCGDDDREHCAHGLCRRCYARRYGRVYRQTSHGRSRLKASLQRWLEKPGNLETYRKIHRHSGRVARDRRFGIDAEMPPLGYEELVYEVFGRRCAACGAENRDLVFDHHRPVQDGHGLLHNAVPLCRRCNAKKGVASPEDFYDGWKLTEINVLLWETREAFERRFGQEVAA